MPQYLKNEDYGVDDAQTYHEFAQNVFEINTHRLCKQARMTGRKSTYWLLLHEELLSGRARHYITLNAAVERNPAKIGANFTVGVPEYQKNKQDLTTRLRDNWSVVFFRIIDKAAYVENGGKLVYLKSKDC